MFCSLYNRLWEDSGRLISDLKKLTGVPEEESKKEELAPKKEDSAPKEEAKEEIKVDD